MNNIASSIIANQHECFLIPVYRTTVKINVFDIKRLFSYVIFFLLATLPVASAYSQSTLKEDRFILFIGHNQISHQYYDNMIKEERDKILKGLEKKSNISMRGAFEPRVAILGYGEKARNGIFFLNVKKDTTMCEVQGKISADYNGETMMLFTFDKKGVLFVSVSIDRGRIEWKNELAEQRMPWLQLRGIDLKNTVLMKK
jgi:hypothetical protein